MTKHKTFVAIKTATTVDGKIATSTGNSKWITSLKARNYAKKLRANYDAILTSSATVLADNPQMVHNKKIILDKNLKTNFDFNIYKSGNILVFTACDKNIITPENVTLVKTPLINGKLDIEFILKTLFEHKIMSVFVEAGGTLCGSILPYTDKLYHFVAPKILNDNSGKSCFNGATITSISDCINLSFEECKKFTPDFLLIYSKNNIG